MKNHRIASRSSTSPGARRRAPSSQRRFAAALLLAVVAGACTTTYEFDPVGVGDEGGGRDPVPRTSTQYVNAVYADLLGRQPKQYDFTVTQGPTELLRFPLDEQDTMVAALDALGDSAPVRDLLVTAIVRSPEAGLPDKADVDDPADFIAEQFRTLLGREPNAYELAAFVDEWNADDAVGPRAVVRAILASREYGSR
jgi:hypothetical protein